MAVNLCVSVSGYDVYSINCVMFIGNYTIYISRTVCVVVTMCCVPQTRVLVNSTCLKARLCHTVTYVRNVAAAMAAPSLLWVVSPWVRHCWACCSHCVLLH